jgi:hypothetical protein
MARTNEALWKRIVAKYKRGSKGGPAGKWTARKAQLAGAEYKKKGGRYKGGKTKAQKSLSNWTKQKWTTGSGKPSTQGKKATGEAYFPAAAVKALKKAGLYDDAVRTKRKAKKAGKNAQYSKRIRNIVRKYR